MKKAYVGIDPGINGGIAAIDELSNVIFSESTPCVKIIKKGKYKSDYDIKSMVGILDSLSEYDVIVCQELTHAMPGNGGVSMYNFGRGHGIWEGIGCALGLAQIFCTPQKWKEMYPDISTDKLSKEERATMSSSQVSSWKRKAKADAKKKSIEKAKELFPSAKEKMSKVKHDGVAEALLIANWIRSQNVK